LTTVLIWACLVLPEQRLSTTNFTITALLIEVAVLILWSKVDPDEGTGGVLKGEIQQVVTNLLSGVVPVSDKLVHQLRYQRLQRTLLVDEGDERASKIAIGSRLFLSLGGVLDDVLNDRVRISTWRNVSVCLPRHRHELVVLVDKAIVARRIVPKPLTTGCWVLVELGLITDLIRQPKATLLFLGGLVGSNTVRRVNVSLDAVDGGREGDSIVGELDTRGLEDWYLSVRTGT
jgi:hypothetical protein